MCPLQMIKLFYLETSVTEAFLSCQSILQIQGMTRSFIRLLVNKKRIVSIKEPAMMFNYIVFSMCTWILSSRKSYMKTIHPFELLPVKLHFITKSCNKKKKSCLLYIFSCALRDIPKSSVISKSLIHFHVLTSYYGKKELLEYITCSLFCCSWQ